MEEHNVELFDGSIVVYTENDHIEAINKMITKDLTMHKPDKDWNGDWIRFVCPLVYHIAEFPDVECGEDVDNIARDKGYYETPHEVHVMCRRLAGLDFDPSEDEGICPCDVLEPTGAMFAHMKLHGEIVA